MDKEIEDLKQKVSQLERLISKDERRAPNHRSGPSSLVPEPKLNTKAEYDQVEGWKLIDLSLLAEALEVAQQSCPHRQLVLVETDRKTQRVGVSAMLGFVCRECGEQTVVTTSRYCRQYPPDYTANKQFSAALGEESYSSLVSLVQADTSIRRLGVHTRGKPPNLLLRFVDQEQEQLCDEEVMLDGAAVKEELLDYTEEGYLEPDTCITETETEEAPSSVDMSTVTTNSPALALATVQPATQVMGGTVTPHPTNQIVTVHPNMFIRTTCSKVFLPPGLYKYSRNNGLQSIMSVRADTGTFEAIESYYLTTAARSKTQNSEKSDSDIITDGKTISDNKIITKSLNISTKRDLPSYLTPMHLFSMELREDIGHKAALKDDFEAMVQKKWSQLSYEEKKAYTDKVVMKASGDTWSVSNKPKREKSKKTTNIPLHALKKFASTVAPGIKEKSPHLAALENRGKLNKIILKKWVNLSETEMASFLNPPQSRDDQPMEDSVPSKRIRVPKKLLDGV